MPNTLLAICVNLIYWLSCFRLVSLVGLPGRAVTVVTTGLVGSWILFVTMPIASAWSGITIGSALVLTALLALAAMVSFRWQGTFTGTSETTTNWEWAPALLSGSLVAAVALRSLARGLLLPVATMSDAPIYHLYFAIRWWQAASIEYVATPFGELAATYFPANGSLWFCWLITCSGNETIAKVGQWPYFILCTVTIYAIGRQFGFKRPASVLPASLWASLPLSHWYANIANVDLLYTFFYLAAFLNLQICVLNPKHQRKHLILFGVALGCALGTKTIGVVFAPLLLLPLFVVLVHRRSFVFGLFVLAFSTTGCGYWFGRNWWVTGNPIYPLRIEVFGIPIFPGWYTKEAMYYSGYHIPSDMWALLIDRLTLMFDLRLVWLWPLSWAAGFVIWNSRVSTKVGDSETLTRRARFAVTTALLAITYLLIYWLILPYNTQERFLAPAVGISFALLTGFLQSRRSACWGIAGFIAWHALTPQWSLDLSGFDGMIRFSGNLLLPVSQFGWILIVAAVISSLALFLSRKIAIVAIVACLLVGATGISSLPLYQAIQKTPLVAFYPPNDFGATMYPTWLTLEEHSDVSRKVAYSGTNLPYYLFGSELQNRVRYVPPNAPFDWLPHQLHRERFKNAVSKTPWPEWYRGNPNYEVWLENLRQTGVDVLFVARENLHGRQRDAGGPAPFPIEYRWATEHPETFTLLGPTQLPPTGVPWAFVFAIEK